MASREEFKRATKIIITSMVLWLPVLGAEIVTNGTQLVRLDKFKTFECKDYWYCQEYGIGADCLVSCRGTIFLLGDGEIIAEGQNTWDFYKIIKSKYGKIPACEYMSDKKQECVDWESFGKQILR